MNLFWKKTQPPTEPAEPEPAVVLRFTAALEKLEAARLRCAELDQQARDWPGRREAAARAFREALEHYNRLQGNA
jgi:hypothetical protein